LCISAAVPHQAQHTAHVLPHRVLLLPREDYTRMRLVLRHIARMETIEISHIETTQDATLRRGIREMVCIRTLDHGGF
jgi:hypothetical protein